MSRNTLITLASLILAAAIPAEPCLAQRTSRTTRLPSRRMLSRHGLVQSWWGQAMIYRGRSTVRYVSLDEEVLYVQTTGGMVTAFDNETGRRLWASQLGPQDAPSQRAVSNVDHVFISTTRRLHCLDKFTGERIWEVTLPKLPSTSPAVDRFQLFYGSHDGSIFAYDVLRIRELYEENRLPKWSYLAQQWRYKTGQAITTPPILTDRVVNFASRDRSLYSITKGKPRLQWQSETEAPISAPMAYADGFVYLASEDFNLYCLNAENGHERWQPFPSGFPIVTAPEVIGPHIYLLPQKGGLFCLSVETGRRIWWRPYIEEFVAATTTRLFTSDGQGNIVILTRQDGTPLGVMPLPQFGLRMANNRTDRIYLATKSGLVVCLREAGSEHEFPVYHRYPQRRPLVPEFAPEAAAPQPAEDNSGNAAPAPAPAPMP